MLLLTMLEALCPLHHTHEEARVQTQGFLPTIRRLAKRSGQALRAVLGRPSVLDQTGLNIRYLYVEVAWAGVLSAAAAFNATFAVRLNASNTMIGWLSSIPCLVAVFVLVPAARFLERRSRRAPWVWGSLFVARLGYGVVALVPWLVSSHQAEVVVWLLIAISVPSAFFAAGFNPLLADVVPEQDRTRVFAMRNILAGATVASLTFVAGRWLEAGQRAGWAPFPLNYQAVYIVGFLGSMMSTVYLLRIKVPESRVAARLPGDPAKPFIHELRTMLTVDRNFAAITWNTLLYDAGAWLVGPLYIIFFVRELGATDGWIGLNSTLANLGVIAGYALWRRWIRRLGYSRGLLISAPLGACYAFLVSLFPSLTLILIWGVLISIINPGINLSHFNILLKLCPDERRPTYLATFSTLMNAGAFVMPMVGVALAGLLGVRAVLLIGGSLRLLGAVLFHVNRIKVQEVDIR